MTCDEHSIFGILECGDWQEVQFEKQTHLIIKMGCYTSRTLGNILTFSNVQINAHFNELYNSLFFDNQLVHFVFKHKIITK